MGGKGSGAKPSYSQEDIDYALTLVAINAGRTQLTSDQLAAQGKRIPQGTLDSWKHHPDGRYDRISKNTSERIAEKVAAQAEAVVLRAAEVEIALLDELEAKKGQLKASELASAVRNVTTTKTLNVEKVASPLRGRPSLITEQRDASEILRALAAKLGQSLEVVPDADVVEETPLQIEAQQPAPPTAPLPRVDPQPA